MNQATTDRTLFALFCLSRDTRHIDATEIARAAGLSPTAAAEALVVLERAGLVDATRARLTMLGLARAAKLSGAGGGRPGVDLRHAKPRRARTAPLAAAPAEREAHATSEVDADERAERGYLEESCTIQ
jgi:DNA-binding transcriptional ArsR family regulator